MGFWILLFLFLLTLAIPRILATLIVGAAIFVTRLRLAFRTRGKAKRTLNDYIN